MAGDDKRSEMKRCRRVSQGVAHPRLKGCAHTEFQACARYLLGISSRHISVVTRRILAHPRTISPPPPPPDTPPPLDATAWHETIFYLQRALTVSCCFFLSCVYRNFSLRYGTSRCSVVPRFSTHRTSFSLSSRCYLEIEHAPLNIKETMIILLS